MKFTIMTCLVLLAGALAVSIVTRSETEIEGAQALQRSVMLSELLGGQEILLNDPRLDGYAQVCLVGYDVIGEALQRCKGAKEKSLLAVPIGNAPCVEFLGPEDIEGRELTILMDGETNCEDVGSKGAISIVAGRDGLIYDRIDFDVRHK